MNIFTLITALSGFIWTVMIGILLPIMFLGIALAALIWAAQQTPRVAMAFHCVCLLLWIVHGACYRCLLRRAIPPLPSLLATASPLALTISIGRFFFSQINGFWASTTTIVACSFSAFITYAVNAKIARWSFLIEEKTPASADAHADANKAPPSQIWNVLPNGLKYHFDTKGEIGMGGPEVSVCYFSNGFELASVGYDNLHISADGHYAVCRDVRDARRFVLIDLEQGRQRDKFDAAEQRAIETNFRHPERLAMFLHSPHCEQLHQFCGLWFPAGLEPPPERLFLCDPKGRKRLYLERRINLATARYPREALLQAYYCAILDGTELPVLTTSAGPSWDQNGDMLLIPGISNNTAEETPGTHWLWQRDGRSGWVNLKRWDGKASLLSYSYEGVRALDHDGCWVDFSMNPPCDDGYPQHFLHSVFPSGFAPDEYILRNWVVGADEHGCILTRDFSSDEEITPTPRRIGAVRLRVRLPWTGEGGAGMVESTSVNGCIARFFPAPCPGDSGFLRYRVKAGAAGADNVALYHLWSDCGRYLALSPHCQEGEAADHFFVLDTLSGACLSSDFRGCGLQLIAWLDGKLQVAVAMGSTNDIQNFSYDPFATLAPPPPPAADGRLFQQWLLIECLRFRVDPINGQLQGPLPKFVDLSAPPYPNAAFDFYYHAPNHHRSVFVFGARNKFQDNDDRAPECRYQARAITSNGICLAGLGVAMIWSDDSRYLMVIAPASLEHPKNDAIAWYARLLDCEKHLIYPAIALEGIPIFKRFLDRSIDYQLLPGDHYVFNDCIHDDTHLAPFDLDTLERLPSQPLIAYEGLWLAPDTDRNPRWITMYTQAFGTPKTIT